MSEPSPLRHTTQEKTHKFIKKQQVLAIEGVVAGAALAMFSPPDLLKAGLVVAGVCLLWFVLVVPLLKWWHHG